MEDGHTGIHYDVLHKERTKLREKEEEIEVVVTRLWFNDGQKQNVVHLPFAKVQEVAPVLTVLGFQEFFKCPLYGFKECMYLSITPEVAWQDSSKPRHMAEFTIKLIQLIEEPWYSAKQSWEILSKVLKQYGKEIFELEKILQVKIN